MTNIPLKVIQWGSGNIGCGALRAVIGHPALELVGLWAHSTEKVGQDAAKICGLPDATGILATNSLEEIVGAEADCVLYMPQGTDFDALCALLESGKNIVTTRGDFHHPASLPTPQRDQIEAACKLGGSTIYSTGSSPGFVTEALPIALLSLSRRLDCLTIDEFADLESRNSPDLLFNVMGFGAPLDEFNQDKADYVKHDFAGSLSQLADACGIAIDRWDAVGEYSAASEDVTIAAGVIEQGTVAAQRITVSGYVGDVARLRFRANWYASDKILHQEWNLRASGWRITVEGDTPLDVTISFPVAPEDYAAFTPGLTAHRAANAVAAVCAALPGIATTATLRQVIAHLGE